jgi:hypothetical protein
MKTPFWTLRAMAILAVNADLAQIYLGLRSFLIAPPTKKGTADGPFSKYVIFAELGD